jgi:hypothetical protein
MIMPYFAWGENEENGDIPQGKALGVSEEN